ncbi:MAG: T9SS type A sorting domain-containing protein [Stygiobacter sp.]
MKKVLLVLFSMFLFSQLTKAQAVFSESFDYTATASDSLKAHNWKLSGSNNSNPIMVVSPGLSLSGYTSKGNATQLKESGQDVYQQFTTITSGSVYLSFLINVTSTSSIGDYFIALSPSTSQTNYTLRIHLKSEGIGLVIGLSKSNELSGGYIYGKTVLNYNTTYLVVGKHTLVAGDKNDEEKIFVFSGNIPSSEPANAEIGPYVETTKSDPLDISMVTLRQGGSFSSGVLTNPGPTLFLDEIRVATNWNDLLTPTSVEKNELPTQFELSQNFPNPFNPETKISYTLPKESNVSLKVYDVLGDEVAKLVNEVKQAGVYNVTFNAKNLTSGLYIYKLQAENYIQTKKMMLIK